MEGATLLKPKTLFQITKFDSFLSLADVENFAVILDKDYFRFLLLFLTLFKLHAGKGQVGADLVLEAVIVALVLVPDVSAPVCSACPDADPTPYQDRKRAEKHTEQRPNGVLDEKNAPKTQLQVGDDDHVGTQASFTSESQLQLLYYGRACQKSVARRRGVCFQLCRSTTRQRVVLLSRDAYEATLAPC